jgi:hypothetical protein
LLLLAHRCFLVVLCHYYSLPIVAPRPSLLPHCCSPPIATICFSKVLLGPLAIVVHICPLLLPASVSPNYTPSLSLPFVCSLWSFFL